MSFAYHGNYCGPGWNNGQYRFSKKDRTVPPVDNFDAICMAHDDVYASTTDNKKLADADFEFAKNTIGLGFKATAAGVVVGAQGLTRSVSNLLPTTRMPKRLLREETINPRDKERAIKASRGDEEGRH